MRADALERMAGGVSAFEEAAVNFGRAIALEHESILVNGDLIRVTAPAAARRGRERAG
jgi:hypothetical protein